MSYSFKFPLELGAHGSFLITDQSVPSGVRCFLSFKLGERVRRPDYGSDIWKLEQIVISSDDIPTLILIDTQAAMIKYFPESVFYNIGVASSNRKLMLTIIYMTAPEEERTSFSWPISLIQ